MINVSESTFTNDPDDVGDQDDDRMFNTGRDGCNSKIKYILIKNYTIYLMVIYENL